VRITKGMVDQSQRKKKKEKRKKKWLRGPVPYKQQSFISVQGKELPNMWS
jgi:hypothetical protein